VKRRITVPDLAVLRLRREMRVAVALAAVAVITAFAVALYFVQPAPPGRIVMSTGPADGDYHRYGLEYRAILAQQGVELELVDSDGALENIGRLMDPASRVDVAFFQSGTGFAANAPNVVSLGTLYYEPLWVFYRGAPITELHELNGRRIALGPEQSGTRPLALQLLAVNSAVLPPTELLPIPGEQAAAMLEAGELDALLHVAPAESPLVQRLIAAKGVRLLGFDRAEAYVRRFPYLTRVTLPRGVFDLVGNVPPRDVVLLSPSANLLARDSLHPALAYLLMRAATSIHGAGSLLSARSDFPALRDADFPYSEQAKRYYKSGPPLLQRYLPYWAAVLVDRLWVMVLPFLAVVVPLSRLLPQLYAWRMRSRLYRWYGRLKEIELELEDPRSTEELNGMLQRLDEIELAVSHIPLPLAFTENLYSFRSNIDLVRGRVQRRLAEPRSVTPRL
jgi:TRAP-type uncharacterized transport system substrate-binding protein